MSEPTKLQKTKAPPSRNAQLTKRENCAKKQNRVKKMLSGEVISSQRRKRDFRMVSQRIREMRL